MRRATGARTSELTFDELQIALYVARGETNRDTAVALSVRPGSIEGHLQRIYRKLGLRSRTELSETLRRRTEAHHTAMRRPGLD